MTKTEDQERYLKKEKEKLYRILKWLSRDIEETQAILNGYKVRHSELKKEFEEADRKLAMIDGRFSVPTLSDDKKRKKIKLTATQIKEAAERLGIEVNE